jgi:hypothetical protein
VIDAMRLRWRCAWAHWQREVACLFVDLFDVLQTRWDDESPVLHAGVMHVCGLFAVKRHAACVAWCFR